MIINQLLHGLTEKTKADAVERLITDSSPRSDFFLLTALSVLMATLGLMTNSVSVIIGSMLIAPLLSPILSVSMGIVMADPKLMSRSFITILKAMAVALPAAAVIALFFTGLRPAAIGNSEIVTRIRPDLASVAIAFIAGLAASFALIKPQLSATLPGVAISVSLIPPLAVTGIGVASLNWGMIAGSLTLFLINAAAIVFASMVVFSFVRFYTKQPVAQRALEKETKELKKEKAEGEKPAA